MADGQVAVPSENRISVSADASPEHSHVPENELRMQTGADSDELNIAEAVKNEVTEFVHVQGKELRAHEDSHFEGNNIPGPTPHEVTEFVHVNIRENGRIEVVPPEFNAVLSAPEDKGEILLQIGTAFSTLEDLLHCLKVYQSKNHVKLYRRDSRTIDNMKKGRCPKRVYKESLKYAELHYRCQYGGKEFISRSTGLRRSSSMRQGCPMHIRFGVSEDGTQLVVKSMSEEHNHEINEDIVVREALHPQLCSYISQLVWNQNDISIETVKTKLEDYVVNVMFKDQDNLPQPNRRLYYPSKKQIRYFMAKARSSLNISDECEVKLNEQATKFKQTRSDEKMIFNFHVKNCKGDIRLKHDDGNQLEEQCILNTALNHATAGLKNDEESLNANILFCHQTPHQQRILKRYSAQIILTQITDVNEKIPFPLFALFVQTNVDYQLVGEIILKKNESSVITEALTVIKDWNPGWAPKFVMVDFSEAQLFAAEEAFPGSFIMISDTSREKAWDDWLSRPSNGLSQNKAEVLTYLQAIASSHCEESLNSSARDLEESDIWNASDEFRNWFQENWLAHAKLWVVGYRPDDYMILRNHGGTLEDEINKFKLIKHRASALEQMIQYIVENIVPESKLQYESYNMESSNLQNKLFYAYHDMPNYLSCRPGLISSHIHDRLQSAKSQNFTITYLHPGIFTVQGNSEDDYTLHTISFGDSTSYPSCDCSDWLFNKLPCVHFAAIFNNYKGWSWDMLSVAYKSNPILTVDWAAMDESVANAVPGIHVDRTTQTSKTQSVLSSLNSSVLPNSKISLLEIPRVPETPQVLASHCFSLLQQLSKLQLVHYSKDTLYRMKTELKELLTALSKAPKAKLPISAYTRSTKDLFKQIHPVTPDNRKVIAFKNLSVASIPSGTQIKVFKTPMVEKEIGDSPTIRTSRKRPGGDSEPLFDGSSKLVLVESTVTETPPPLHFESNMLENSLESNSENIPENPQELQEAKLNTNNSSAGMTTEFSDSVDFQGIDKSISNDSDSSNDNHPTSTTNTIQIKPEDISIT